MRPHLPHTGTPAVNRFPRLAGIVLGALVLGIMAGTAAAANGAITGVVRNGTTGQPVAGEMITLVVIGPQGPEGTGQTRSDATGRFAFRGLADGRYLLQASRQGVSYAAQAVISGGATVDLVVQVFDVSDRVPLRVALFGMVVDVQPGYVRISEVVHLQNPTSQTFLGPVVFPLPRGARYITFSDGLRRPKVEGTQILDQVIVRPGALQVAYGYSIAGSGEVAVDRRLLLPVDRIELFTAAPAEVRSPRLEPLPNVTNEGQMYTRASGRAVPPGDLAMSVVGVPAARMWLAPAAAGTLAGLLIIGLMAAIAREAQEAPGGVVPEPQNR
jgi:hypothetical protein